MSGKSRKRARLSIKDDHSQDKKVRTSLTDIPDVPALKIASYLQGKDLLNFSHSCQRIFHICDGDSKLWRKQLSYQNFPLCQQISDAASALVDNGTSAFKTNKDKLTYIMHLKTRENWRAGKFTRKANIPKGNVTGQPMFGTERAGSLQMKGRGASKRFSFNVWDVKSGNNKTYNFNAPLAVQMLNESDKDLENCFTAKSVATLQFRSSDSDQIHFVAIKLDEATQQANDLWSASAELNGQPFSFTCDSKGDVLYLFTWNSSSNGSNLLVQGFRLQTGHQFLNYTIINDRIHKVPGPFASHENCIVFTCNDGYATIVLDTVQKSLQILIQPFQVLDLAVKDGKVLGCSNNGLAIIWNLFTGEILHIVEDKLLDDDDSTCLKEIVRFDPNGLEFSVRETISLIDRVPSLEFRTMKMQPGFEFEEVHDKSFEIGPDWPTSVCVTGDTFVFDLALRFDFRPSLFKPKQASVTSFSMASAGIKNKSFNLMPEKEYFAIEQIFVAPTFVSIAAGPKIIILDFLNVEQFVKK